MIQRWAGQFIYLVLTLMRLSWRYRLHDTQHLEAAKAMSAHGNFVFALFHEHTIGLVVHHRRQRVTAMVSKSQDGEIAAACLHGLGLRTARGSSRKGGKAAKDEMIEQMKTEHFSSAFTVDGPKGPRRKVKSGCVDVATQAQVPILPLVCTSSPKIVFNSWDRLQFPLPFARIDIMYAKPLVMAPSTSPSQYSSLAREIETSLGEAETRLLETLRPREKETS